MSTAITSLKNQLEKYHGVARMNPLWICATRYTTGKRLKVHPDTLYPKGFDKGPVCERWFCSVGINDTEGNINPDTMSYFGLDNHESISFAEAISVMGDDLLGKETMKKNGTFDMFAKIYDYGVSAFPLHSHCNEEYAKRIGKKKKTEANYFPVELNRDMFGSELAYIGLLPGVTKEQFLEAARGFNDCSVDIQRLCQAFKMERDTGWIIPIGVLHAPSSAATYEPQTVSDVLTVWQNGCDDRYIAGNDELVSIIPKDYTGDPIDYLFGTLDWEANFLNAYENFFIRPIPVKDEEEMKAEGYREDWIVYNIEGFSSKKLRVHPGQKVVIQDAAAYGFVMLQGYGTINGMQISTPSIIRVGEETEDEGFVTKAAATTGVVIENNSQFEDLVMLKHFSSDNEMYVK